MARASRWWTTWRCAPSPDVARWQGAAHHEDWCRHLHQPVLDRQCLERPIEDLGAGPAQSVQDVAAARDESGLSRRRRLVLVRGDQRRCSRGEPGLALLRRSGSPGRIREQTHVSNALRGWTNGGTDAAHVVCARQPVGGGGRRSVLHRHCLPAAVPRRLLLWRLCPRLDSVPERRRVEQPRVGSDDVRLRSAWTGGHPDARRRAAATTSPSTPASFAASVMSARRRLATPATSTGCPPSTGGVRSNGTGATAKLRLAMAGR